MYPTATGREVQRAMVEGSSHLHERKAGHVDNDTRRTVRKAWESLGCEPEPWMRAGGGAAATRGEAWPRRRYARRSAPARLAGTRRRCSRRCYRSRAHRGRGVAGIVMTWMRGIGDGSAEYPMGAIMIGHGSGAGGDAACDGGTGATRGAGAAGSARTRRSGYIRKSDTVWSHSGGHGIHTDGVFAREARDRGRLRRHVVAALAGGVERAIGVWVGPRPGERMVDLS